MSVETIVSVITSLITIIGFAITFTLFWRTKKGDAVEAERRTTEIASDIHYIKKDIREIKETVSRYNERFTALESRLAKVETKVDELEKKHNERFLECQKKK